MDVAVVGRMLSTLPADDDHPYRTGAWRPQTTEWRADDLVVEGTLPDDLEGVYLRNTENPVHPAIGRYHPFDGDGMVHAVVFRGGRAHYRNRFVRTEGLLAEQEAGGPLWAGLAERPERGLAGHGWGARGMLKDSSSTDVVVHAGVALTSFYQCGDLYRLDPLTLETLGRSDWEGRFPAWGVSAHAKVDAVSGELLFFNYSKSAPYMHYGVVDADDRLAHLIEVPLPGPRLPHDMVATQRHTILNDCPLYWDPEGLRHNVHAARFHPDQPTRLAVVPRHGATSAIRWFEAQPTYVLHWVNAYEEGEELVVDGFFQGDPEPADDGRGSAMERMFRYLALDRMQTRLHRWRLDMRTGETREEVLSDEISEFGVINPLHAGRPHRYVYAASGVPGWFLFDGLLRHDLRNGTIDRLMLEPGVYASEPAFAPRPGGVAEDDGWLITLTTDVATDRSECLVLDAADLGSGPVARLRLPERISSGTHSTWAPAAAVAGWV